MSEIINVMPKYKNESHSEYAYRIIRENIMQFKLLPGSQLNEVDLANALNISRTPVHEAVNRLKEEQLVDVIPRKESKVSLINISLVNEGIFMRCSIEPEIIKLIAGNVHLDYIKKLQLNLDIQKRILDEKTELYKYYPVDDEFHKIIYEAANKSTIYSYVQKVVGHFDRVRRLARLDGQFDIALASNEEHKELFSILMFGLPAEEDLDAFFQKHIMRFQSNMPLLLEEHADYFTFV